MLLFYGIFIMVKMIQIAIERLGNAGKHRNKAKKNITSTTVPTSMLCARLLSASIIPSKARDEAPEAQKGHWSIQWVTGKGAEV